MPSAPASNQGMLHFATVVIQVCEQGSVAPQHNFFNSEDPKKPHPFQN